MNELIYRILASATVPMWKEEANLGDYTSATSQHELNIAFHYASRLRRWLPWLNCDFDVQKPNLGHMRPDIIFHGRGGHAANFLVVEIKRGDDLSGGRDDLKKIEDDWFHAPYLYRFGASVVFNEKKRTTKLCVVTRGAPEALNGYRDAATFAPIDLPRAGEEFRACVECVSDTLEAEGAGDEARVKALEAEIDAHVCRLFGLPDTERNS